ncbi:hypothetical protein [Paenibacillus sp. NRS-1760]|uniref:hypothetical protein n=1 Tax=Paenibacillus sp. NRS-1760 TaxID=3233902 RepID=UPI003D2A31D6
MPFVFLVQARKKAYSKQNGQDIRLKNVHVNRIMLLSKRSSQLFRTDFARILLTWANG